MNRLWAIFILTIGAIYVCAGAQILSESEHGTLARSHVYGSYIEDGIASLSIINSQLSIDHALPPITPPLPESSLTRSPSPSQTAACLQDTYILILITPDGTILRARGGIAEKNPLKPVFRDAHYGTSLYAGYFAIRLGTDPFGRRCKVYIFMGHSSHAKDYIDSMLAKLGKCDFMGDVSCFVNSRMRDIGDRGIPNWPRWPGILHCNHRELSTFYAQVNRTIMRHLAKMCRKPCCCKQVTRVIKCDRDMLDCILKLKKDGVSWRNPCFSGQLNIRKDTAGVIHTTVFDCKGRIISDRKKVLMSGNK